MTGQQLNLPGTPEPAVKLTERQATVLQLLQTVDLLDVDEAGALYHSLTDGRTAHPADTRCGYCAAAGRQVLEALVRKGAARRRRIPGRVVYEATSRPAHTGPDPAGDWRDLPVSQGGYGTLPEGY